MNHSQQSSIQYRLSAIASSTAGDSSYLRAYKAADIYVPIRHYICREPSTNQLLFMQNKPNLVRRRRIANVYDTKDYRKNDDFAVRKNKPNSNPIKPNSNPIAERVKLMKSVYLQRITKKNATKGYEKTNPKQTQTKPFSSLAKKAGQKLNCRYNNIAI